MGGGLKCPPLHPGGWGVSIRGVVGGLAACFKKLVKWGRMASTISLAICVAHTCFVRVISRVHAFDFYCVLFACSICVFCFCSTKEFQRTAGAAAFSI